MKTASEITAAMSDRDLANVLGDIANEHLDRSTGSLHEIPHLNALENRAQEYCPSMSRGMAMIIAKEAALVEGCNRWLKGLAE